MEFPSLSQKEFTLNTDNDPHGWIQWKGTDVCMDVRCSCGFVGHVDGYFGYFVKCPECNQHYEVNGHVQFIPVDDPDSECVLVPETNEGG